MPTKSKYNTEYWKKRLGPEGYKLYLRKRADATRRWRDRNPEKDKASQRRKYLQAREHRIAYAIDYKAQHPEKAKEWARTYALRKKYGVERVDYDELLAKQGGVCAICGRTQKKPLFVDHEHKTGRVRGLLCHHCNLAIANFNEDPNLIDAAIEYLKLHSH